MDEELTPSPPSPTASVSSPASKPIVLGVCLVGFDHQIGPIVDWTYPTALSSHDQVLSTLPWLALPDGAHTREEDYSYFNLLLPTLSPSTVFGISCNRSISSSALIAPGKDVTRSSVQKSVVVLATKPIFGPLRDKLGVVTRVFFDQKNFEDKSVLVDLFKSLEFLAESSAGDELADEAGGMYMGTSLRELVRTFRGRTLVLFKLLLLQRKVLFYATNAPVEQLCGFQFSLVALVPLLLTHLEDCASPELDESAKRREQPTSLKTTDKGSLLRYLGLPLDLFGKDAFFQPYLPLQQIDLLQSRSYLVGTRNPIFQQQRDCPIDVIVNIETASLEVLDPKLSALSSLTAADRKWMDEIVHLVDQGFNSDDPTRPSGLTFIGSDDHIRASFSEYTCSFLSSIKFADYLASQESKGQVLLSKNESDANGLAAFNKSFVTAFKATPAFSTWNAATDNLIFDLVEPKHPMEGRTNPLEDVGIRLAHGLHDLHIDENLAPARDALSRGFTSGTESVSSIWSNLGVIRRQPVGDGTTTTPARSYFTPPRLDLAPPPIVTQTIFAGVDVAKTGVTTLANGITGLGSTGATHLANGLTGFGSFLNSTRTQIFSPSAPTTPIPSPNAGTKAFTLNSGKLFRPPPPLNGDDLASSAPPSTNGGMSPTQSRTSSPTPTPRARNFSILSTRSLGFFFKPETPSTTSSSSREASTNADYPKDYSDGFSGTNPSVSRVDIEDLEEELGPVRDLDAEFAQKLKTLQLEREREEASRKALQKVERAIDLHGISSGLEPVKDEESRSQSRVGELDELDFDVPVTSKWLFEDPENPPQDSVSASEGEEGRGDVEESSFDRSEMSSEFDRSEERSEDRSFSEMGDDSERSSVLELKRDHFLRSLGMPGQAESESEEEGSRRSSVGEE